MIQLTCIQAQDDLGWARQWAHEGAVCREILEQEGPKTDHMLHVLHLDNHDCITLQILHA